MNVSSSSMSISSSPHLPWAWLQPHLILTALLVIILRTQMGPGPLGAGHHGIQGSAVIPERTNSTMSCICKWHSGCQQFRDLQILPPTHTHAHIHFEFLINSRYSLDPKMDENMQSVFIHFWMLLTQPTKNIHFWMIIKGLFL